MRSSAIAATLIVLWSLSSAGAQELEPRAYRALPMGLHFGLLGYTLSSGNVVVDATAPVDGLELELNTITAGYLRSLSLFGRSATAAIMLPYVLASGSGSVNGVPIRGSRNAPADARLRLTVNLHGAPAMTMQEFARSPHKRTIGVSLAVAAPTGQYNSKKLVNFGANRWGFKPEIGYSGKRGRWINDVAAGVWLFTKNHDGPGGTTRSQDPIGSFQIHLSYNFENGMWLAVDANYFTGGRSSIDGVRVNDLQQNSRIGLTLSVPLGHRDSIKLAASTGAFTRIGADFDIGAVAYQRRFGGPPVRPPGAEDVEED